jgi:hypothetical protein
MKKAAAVGDSTDTLRACETRRRVTGAPEAGSFYPGTTAGVWHRSIDGNVEMGTPTAPPALFLPLPAARFFPDW